MGRAVSVWGPCRRDDHEDRGYDIGSRDPAAGRLRSIEMKGRVEGARTVTVTRNEILASFNSAEQWVLGLVEARGGDDPSEHRVRYLREPFDGEQRKGTLSRKTETPETAKRPGGPTSATYCPRRVIAAEDDPRNYA